MDWSNFTDKGRSANEWDSATKTFEYALLFGEHNMFGFEGSKEGFPPRKAPVVDTGQVVPGIIAQVQNDNYDFDQMAQDADKARENVKGTAITSKKREVGEVNVGPITEGEMAVLEAGSVILLELTGWNGRLLYDHMISGQRINKTDYKEYLSAAHP